VADDLGVGGGRADEDKDEREQEAPHPRKSRAPPGPTTPVGRRRVREATMPGMPSAAIIGAGVFGSSLAWWLARGGWDVTLVDQFEPGDARATSGGETRLIRCGHGEDALYIASAWRARTLWRELEAECGAELLVECGLAWFAHDDDGWERASARALGVAGIPYERLEPTAAARRFPSLAIDDLAFVLFEPHAGVLRAQAAVRALAAQAVAHGARLVRGRARPDGARALLGDGTAVEADRVVWACGAWLGMLFRELVALRVTRQELFFLDGGPAWAAPGVPGWVDFDGALYGTGDLDGLGVKAAHDADGPPLDPDAPLLVPEPDSARRVQALAAARFPALADAPLKGAKSCRYELSANGHFVVGEHPDHPGVWLLGGGSGHGFKHGPALAERIASAWASGPPLPAEWALGARGAGRSLRTAGAHAL
jgi:glycine/D-amino acid oxidase-like deaminating enzyme